MHPEVKSALLTFLKNLNESVKTKLKKLTEETGEFLPPEDEDIVIDRLTSLQSKLAAAEIAIREKANSPISESLKQFSIALTG